MNTAENITHQITTIDQIPPAIAVALILVLWPAAIYLTVRARAVSTAPVPSGTNHADMVLREDPEPWVSRLDSRWRGDCPDAFPEYLGTWGVEYAPRPPATSFPPSVLPSAHDVPRA